MKQVQIKDKNELKTFEIDTLSAISGLDLLLDLSQLLIDTPEVSAKSLIQLLNNMAQTGEFVEGSTNKQVEVAASKLLSPGGVDMSFLLTLLVGAVQRLDKDKRNMLLNLVLQHTKFVNGDVKMKLTLNGDISTNVNSYIKSPMALIMLTKEFLTHNMMEIFGDFFMVTEANTK